jgi:hypothetical protein
METWNIHQRCKLESKSKFEMDVINENSLGIVMETVFIQICNIDSTEILKQNRTPVPE